MTSRSHQKGSLEQSAEPVLCYQVATFDDRTLGQTLWLLRVCFPRAGHFTADFLDWLYRASVGAPVGYNVFIGDEIVGHLVGIPERIRLCGKPVTALLFCNVATHPDCRGKGLFLELAKRTALRARELGHAAIIGVANQNTIRGTNRGLVGRTSLALRQGFVLVRRRWTWREPSIEPSSVENGMTNPFVGEWLTRVTRFEFF